MKSKRLDADRLMALSRLLRYPQRWPEDEDMVLLGAGGDNPPKIVVQKDLAALQAAYVYLFINALPEVPCPPYGSFYLEGTLMGESTVQLSRLYAEYGFEAEELADHIAVELEFIALLSILASDPAVREDYEFFLDHLRQWAPAFFTAVKENDASGFYGRVVQLAAAEISTQTRIYSLPHV